MAKDNLDCDDCGMNTFYEFYVVHDGLWDQYGSRWMLCVGCLESRMGRQLVTEDFTAANFNPHQLNNSSRASPHPDGHVRWLGWHWGLRLGGI